MRLNDSDRSICRDQANRGVGTKTWLRKVGLIAAILVLAGFCSLHSIAVPPLSSIASSDPETIQLGMRLFAQNCISCHGRKAVGENPATPSGGWKPKVGHLAPALNGTGHTWHHPPGYLFRIIREGSTIKGSRMKGWAGRMNDFEILAVIAYFQSLWPPRIKDAYRHRYLHRVWK